MMNLDEIKIKWTLKENDKKYLHFFCVEKKKIK